jgi:hypothetical protein
MHQLAIMKATALQLNQTRGASQITAEQQTGRSKPGQNSRPGQRNKRDPNNNMRNRHARNSNKDRRNKRVLNNNKDRNNKPALNSNQDRNSKPALNSNIQIAGNIPVARLSNKGRNSSSNLNSKGRNHNSSPNNARRVVNSILRVAVNTVVAMAVAIVPRNKNILPKSPASELPGGAFYLYIPPSLGGRGAQFILYGAIK